MEINEALALFGLDNSSDSDVITNAIEEKLFSLKNEMLQKYMVPVLLSKKLTVLQELMIAEFLLNSHTVASKQNPPPTWTDRPADRISFLEQYERQISALKLFLMESRSFHQVHQIVQSFIITQEYYMVLFRMLFNEFSEALPEEVNTREIIDTGKLLTGLKAGEPDNKLTWEIEREIARIDKISNLKVTGSQP